MKVEANETCFQQHQQLTTKQKTIKNKNKNMRPTKRSYYSKIFTLFYIFSEEYQKLRILLL